MVTSNAVEWQPFSKAITINAPAIYVWKALTEPVWIEKWLLDEELEVIADWRVGGSVSIKGTLHWVDFETKGKVLNVEPGKLLRYQQLSSLSNLTDIDENYSVIEFRLELKQNQTVLTIELSNFPTEAIYRHMVFYWGTTLGVIKNLVEVEV